uniref:Uncharacterized protein n=1 Tax=Cannabis sativa TaxID=3483 RepID=A0A803Q222_CANSA
MPLEGIFIEASSSTPTVLPDLSLNISPPNTTSTCSSSAAAAALDDARFDLDLSCRRREADNNNLTACSSSSTTTTTNTSKAHTDLSLGRLSLISSSGSNLNGAGDQPQNPYHHHQQHHPQYAHHLYNHTINRGGGGGGLSLLDVSADAFRPIKGIPVYHNRSFPFFSADNTRVVDHMYRTVKTTDKPAASSGQSEGSGEDEMSQIGMSGSDSTGGLRTQYVDQRGPPDRSNLQPDQMDYQTSLWSNSSRY